MNIASTVPIPPDADAESGTDASATSDAESGTDASATSDDESGTDASATSDAGTGTPSGPTGPARPPGPPGPPTGHRRAPMGADRLHRSRDHRMVAGVADGLADYFDIDTTLVRVGFVALTLFGGLAVPLYLAGWLLIPEEGDDRSVAEDLLGHHRTA